MGIGKVKVWIEKQFAGEDDKSTAERILSKMELEQEFSPDERILINPNWIIDESSSQGNVTSTSTIEGLVNFLINSTRVQAKNIIVGDGGYSSSTPGCMRTNNVFELEAKYGIEIRNLNEEPMIGSAIIGYTPKHAKYLVEASKKGLGTYRLEEIDVVGPNIDELYRKFKH